MSTTKNPFGLPPFQSALILKLYLRDKVQTKFSCAKKETVDIDNLVASRKGDRKIMECTLIFYKQPVYKQLALGWHIAKQIKEKWRFYFVINGQYTKI